MTAARLLRLAALLAASCGGGATNDGDATLPAAQSLLPDGYGQRFVQVRDCRSSIDHGLVHIVIKTDPALARRYDQGPFPLPVGTVVLKEEFSDPACSALTGWTLMRKEPAGYDEHHADWHWQRLDASQHVVQDGKLPGCASCHAAAACRARDFTCAEP